MLLDPATLQAVIPGCHGVEKISDTHFRADVDARRRSREGTLPRRGQARPTSIRRTRSRSAARPKARSDSAAAKDASPSCRCADGGTRDPLRLRGGDRRQGGEHRRPPARRRRAGDRSASSSRRWRARRAAPQPVHSASFLACEAASPVRRAAMKPARVRLRRAEHLDEALERARPAKAATPASSPAARSLMADAQHAPGAGRGR